ncbi:hypothetical protein Lal_00027234 [Lupinus albus]|nr:hypothetical protein Lal_00027234 [Lupinus albus]
MADNRPKRLKTTANRPRCIFEEGGSSSATAGRTTIALQDTRLTQIQGRKLAYVRYADVSNFLFKNGHYVTMVKGKMIVLDEDLFLVVGELSSSGAPLGDYENEQWEDFEAVNVYKSCLRDSVAVTLGGLTKLGALTVESRLLHYIVAYILGILMNWHTEILRVMSDIASSSSRLLAYGIFISMFINYLEIDTSDVEVKETNTHDHLLGEYLIHKMGIYWLARTWMYQEDYRTTVDLDILDEETHAEQHEKPAAQREVSQASQALPFGLAHLDTMEQRLNQRMDDGFQLLIDSWEGEILGHTGEFSPERELSRLGEKWHFGAVDTMRFSLDREGQS